MSGLSARPNPPHNRSSCTSVWAEALPKEVWENGLYGKSIIHLKTACTILHDSFNPKSNSRAHKANKPLNGQNVIPAFTSSTGVTGVIYSRRRAVECICVVD